MTEMLSFFSYPLELFSAAIVFSLPLARKKHAWIYLLVYLSVFFVLFGIMFQAAYGIADAGLMIEADFSLMRTISSLFWCGLLFFCSIGLVWCCCEVPLREAIYCATCAYLMEHMAYCLRLIASSPVIGMNVTTGTLLYYLDYIVVYFIVFFLFTRRMVQKGHYVTSALDSVSLMVSVLLIVMVMSILATQYGFESIHGIYALMSCTYALYGQLAQQRKLSLQSELTLQKQLWQQQKNQYEISRDTIDIINHKCHDLKHQIAALKAVEDSAYRRQIIDSLESSVMIYDSHMHTGNEILDTVLNEKSLLCQQRGIALNCIADGSGLSFMDAVDLYTLFGNAMDNAIEAVQNLPSENRLIRLAVRKKAGLILIRLENPYSGSIELKDGMPLTSKQDKNYHGFGVGSIRTIAEKYHGIFSLDTQDGIFCLQITIPLSECIQEDKNR